MRRREFLALAASIAPAQITSESSRPQVAQGVQIGDVVPGRALIWSRSDRPARMIVEWSTTASFTNVRKIVGPHALEPSDFTVRADLTGLPSGQTISYRVQFQSLADGKVMSEPVTGSFRSAPVAARDIRFLWSGDTVGQGYGINPDWGGMRIYETMRKRTPDFFLHSGDTIYADGLIQAEVKLKDGSIWRNLTTESKSKVAETLDEFRGAYKYNLLDENIRRFNAAVPQIWAWDDHEVMNNWSPSKDLATLSNYREKSVPLLVARGTRAFLEYAPLRYSSEESERIYRHIPYGSLLEVFVIDMRTYRGPNTHSRQQQESEETVYLGNSQFEWLQRGLLQSQATWKVVAADMPLGLMVGDAKDAQGRPRFEASANGDGPALGRELEISRLLKAIKPVRNVVWLTADTHYTAAHRYDPAKAQFNDFSPFWEFVSGPLNAGTFGPNPLDNTFGPEVVFFKAPPKGESNLPPNAGMQFFGEVEISAKTKEMTVHLKDVGGATLFSRKLPAS